ncbi:NADAR domain-containing protein [Pseudozyma hubeiensis]|nr:NADAR domain-containing protein [Pseudozyma hubeiensis]
MSSAAVSPAPGGAHESTSTSTNRRSLFKPHTWKKSTRSQAQDALKPAGVDSPDGEAVTGVRNVDGVETGAPLTSLVSPTPPKGKGVEREAGLGTAFANPAPLSSAPKPPKETTKPSSELTFTTDSLGRILFFRQDHPNFPLSNSSPSYPVVYNSVRYVTAEHLFQSLKFPANPEIANKIRRAKTPLDAMRIARSHTSSYPAGWFSEGLNVKIMHDVVLAKFSQWPGLRDALLESGDAEICNVSPTDVFWGTGEGERGRNVLGKVLMDVREVLRRNAGVGYGSGAKTM